MTIGYYPLAAPGDADGLHGRSQGVAGGAHMSRPPRATSSGRLSRLSGSAVYLTGRAQLLIREARGANTVRMGAQRTASHWRAMIRVNCIHVVQD